MKITQTRMHSLIYHGRKLIFTIVSVWIMWAGLFYFELVDMEAMPFQIVTTVALPAFIVLWLLIFNSGKNRDDEYSFTIDHTEIRHSTLTRKQSMPLDELTDFRVTGLFRGWLKIKGKSNNIQFDLYQFDSAQRGQIVRELQRLTKKRIS